MQYVASYWTESVIIDDEIENLSLLGEIDRGAKPIDLGSDRAS